jgi:signal transduction histidine kinase
MRSAGLRTRVTAGFAAGALILSTLMAVVSYQMIRGSLLQERERTATRAAYYNAAVVGAGVSGADPDIVEVLRSLDTGGSRRAVLLRDDQWYARNADRGLTEAIPLALQRLVGQGRPAAQRVRVDGEPAIVVGVPLTSSMSFYSVDSLAELDRTFQLLAIVLTVVAMIIGAAGAVLGWYATRYVMRPLVSVAAAAQDIAAGDLEARLDPAAEPDLKRLTNSFNAMVDQLSRRLERDRRFAADVSHELRSPLQTLSAAVSVLRRRRGQVDDRTAAAAGLVADEVERFSSLVNDLIELARSDRPATREPVDVVRLARQVCRRRGLPEALVSSDEASMIWHVDRRRMEQVLGNLLDNAITHGGGPCAVRLGREANACFVEVDDDGPGVSVEDRNMIFERFVRGRAANARGAGDGTGLGLALVAQHAAAHDGRVSVLDRPGGGARFRVELCGCTP